MVEEAVARQQDMAVVGVSTSLDELSALARDTEPHVVVVGLHDSVLPDACVDLLLERPRTKVLAVEEHEGHAYLWELRPEQVEIGEVSPEDMVTTIREAVQRPLLR